MLYCDSSVECSTGVGCQGGVVMATDARHPLHPRQPATHRQAACIQLPQGGLSHSFITWKI